MHLTIARQRGFTLVEVIVALLVAGLSLVSLFLVYQIGTRNSGLSVEAQRADMLAASYSEELLSSRAYGEGQSDEHDESRYKTVAPCPSPEQFFLSRSDQPPVLFDQPYTGPDDIYAQYQVDVYVQCRPVSNSDVGAIEKVRLSVHGASGQSYEYSMLRRFQ